MDLYQSFLNLIDNIEPVTIILAIYGLILVVTAFVKYSYGVFACTGTLSLIASIAIRLLNGGNLAQVFIMVFLMLMLITFFFIMTVRSSKYGWIIRMPLSPVREGVKEFRIKKR